MDLKEKILVALGLDKEVQLGWQGKSEDGTIFVSTAEELDYRFIQDCMDEAKYMVDEAEDKGADMGTWN